ncbi:MAG TPA: LapA family protein [Thermomicrobiales bacterium]|nr:LapA family protein [Thermomicrobiales bacterium]
MSQTRPADTPGSFGVRFRWTPKLIAWLVLLLVSLILIFQNWDLVDINVLFWGFTARLAWVLVTAFLAGALLGWAVPWLRRGVRRR